MFLRKSCVAAACGAMLLLSSVASAQTAAGTLQFQANGEELAVKGFKAPKLTKDGWTLKFSNIYIGLANIVAHQSAPAYNRRKRRRYCSQSQGRFAWPPSCGFGERRW